MTLRTQKVSSLVRKEIARELLDLDLSAMVTVSRAEVSPDMRHAKIFITILPSDAATEKKVLNILSAEIYHLQGGLNKKLATKIVPRISFKVDYSPSTAQYISSIIKDANE